MSLLGKEHQLLEVLEHHHRLCLGRQLRHLEVLYLARRRRHLRQVDLVEARPCLDSLQLLLLVDLEEDLDRRLLRHREGLEVEPEDLVVPLVDLDQQPAQHQLIV